MTSDSQGRVVGVSYVVLRQSVSGNDGEFDQLDEAMTLCDFINQRDRADCERRGVPVPPCPDAYVERRSPLGVERVLRTPTRVILCGPYRAAYKDSQ